MAKEKLTKEQLRELHCEINQMFLDRSFPVFDTDKYLNLFEKFPLFRKAECSEYNDYIDVMEIGGDNWAFIPEGERGNYPHVSKIRSIVDYYGGVLKYGNEDIPPVPVEKVNGVYYLDEGNHRLYTLKYLLDKGLIEDTKISARVYEYDYDSFIKNAKVISRWDGKCIVLNNYNLIRISDEEANVIEELQENLNK